MVLVCCGVCCEEHKLYNGLSFLIVMVVSTYEALSDKELLTAWSSQHDDCAFATLYVRHWPMVERFAESFETKRIDVEERVSLARFAFFDKCEKYDGDASFSSFICKCVRNYLIDATRSKKYKAMALLDDQTVTGSVGGGNQEYSFSYEPIASNRTPDESVAAKDFSVWLGVFLQRHFSPQQYHFLQVYAATGSRAKAALQTGMKSNSGIDKLLKDARYFVSSSVERRNLSLAELF